MKGRILVFFVAFLLFHANSAEEVGKWRSFGGQKCISRPVDVPNHILDFVWLSVWRLDGNFTDKEGE